MRLCKFIVALVSACAILPTGNAVYAADIESVVQLVTGTSDAPVEEEADAAAVEMISVSDCTASYGSESGWADKVGSTFESRCCDPVWTVRAGAIAMQRSRPTSAVLVTDSFDPGGNVILNANQFHFNYKVGFEVSAIRHRVLGSCWDLEGRLCSMLHASR